MSHRTGTSGTASRVNRRCPTGVRQGGTVTRTRKRPKSGTTATARAAVLQVMVAAPLGPAVGPHLAQLQFMTRRPQAPPGVGCLIQ